MTSPPRILSLSHTHTHILALSLSLSLSKPDLQELEPLGEGIFRILDLGLKK